MRKILLIVIGVIGMFLTACDDDKEMSLSDIPIRLSGKILGMDEGEALARFRGGAGVGVYIVDASERQTEDLLGARVSNKKFMQSADGLVGDPLVYWNWETGIEFAAYYPYLSENGILCFRLQNDRILCRTGFLPMVKVIFYGQEVMLIFRQNQSHWNLVI